MQRKGWTALLLLRTSRKRTRPEAPNAAEIFSRAPRQWTAYALLALFGIGWSSSLPEIDLPIEGLTVADVRDTFAEVHSGHPHEAIDLLSPKGTPVHAAVSGTIRKLFLSKAGGNTIYEFDEIGAYCYYYAHLDRYAENVHEGLQVERGAVIGFVGSTGNADPGTPHLHFAIFELGPDKRWWQGKALNPYPALIAAAKRGK